MSPVVGFICIIMVCGLVLNLLYHTINHYKFIKSKSKKRVHLARGLTNIFALLTVIGMFIMKMMGFNYIYGFFLMIVILFVGGMLSFILDLLVREPE